VDTQTRHALKQDKFVTATTSGLEWIGEHRSPVIQWSIAVVAVIAVVVASIVVYHNRTVTAESLLGQAMDIYETPLTVPNQPAEPGVKTYATAAARAKDAFPLFQQVADQYGWLHAGAMGRYFAGITALDLGQQGTAATYLEKATHSGGSNLEALAKLALANLDEQTGHSAEAIALFQDLIQHPATTVPKAEAQLQLAALYDTTQPDAAKRLYAQIQDQNKGTDAAQIASEKLHELK